MLSLVDGTHLEWDDKLPDKPRYEISGEGIKLHKVDSVQRRTGDWELSPWQQVRSLRRGR